MLALDHMYHSTQLASPRDRAAASTSPNGRIMHVVRVAIARGCAVQVSVTCGRRPQGRWPCTERCSVFHSWCTKVHAPSKCETPHRRHPVRRSAADLSD